ncbi:MAG: efflux RND transporter periplasmic adaptor subunit [Desulfobacterales bacterium]
MRAKLLLFLFFFIVLPWVNGCGEIGPGTVEKSSGRTARVEVAVVKPTTHPEIYEAMGTVLAQTTSILSSKLMGTVRSILVEEGQPVKAGQPLVLLDQRQVSAQLQQAEAALSEARKAEQAAASAQESARAAAELAHLNYDRYVLMLREEAVTPQEFDTVAARHRQAQAALTQAGSMVAAARSRVQQARAAVAAASVTHKDAVINAAYDGVMVDKLVEVGDLAAPGTPLVKIERTGNYRVDLELPEGHILSVRIGDTVAVRVPGLIDEPLDGIVATIVPAADTKSRSFLVKVRLPDAANLRSGVFARVAVPIGTGRLILVPTSAVVHEGQLTGIYIVDPDQIARFRLIRTGKSLGNTIEVLSGLQEGARFVVTPPPGFSDRTKVEADS